MRAVRIHADKRVSQLIQYAREIVIEPRTQEELFEPIPPRATSPRSSARASTARPAASPSRRGAERRRAPAHPLARARGRRRRRGRRSARGRAPPSAAAATRRSTSSTTPARRRRHPLLYNEVVVETLARAPAHVDVLHGKLAPLQARRRRTSAAARRPARLGQAASSSPTSRSRRSSARCCRVIVGSTFTDLGRVPRVVRARPSSGFTEPDDQVRRLAADLTQGQDDARARSSARSSSSSPTTSAT